ncbi:hypothetical protein D3C86_1603970 [compost metagenome]
MELPGPLRFIHLDGSGTEEIIHLGVVVVGGVDIGSGVLDAVGPVEALHARRRIEQPADAVHRQVKTALRINALDEGGEIAFDDIHLHAQFAEG